MNTRIPIVSQSPESGAPDERRLPLAKCAAGQLEISPVPARPDSHALPDLPPYIDRDHDRILRSKIRRVAAGESGLVTLVGNSATGKKRALWEAIHCLSEDGKPLFDGWRLWPGTSPSGPEPLLAHLDRIIPKSIVYLPLAERYFIDNGVEIGNEVGRKLRVRLADEDRAPVLVLVTVRPRIWQMLTTPHFGAGPDQYGHVRLLLSGTDIVVPDRFRGPEIDAALGSGDSRLVRAAQVSDGYLIKHIVAAPSLQAMFDTASPTARAVLDCAIEARRIGHRHYLPRELLRRGAVGYLSRSERSMLDDDWFDVALAELTRRGRGDVSLLTDRDHWLDSSSHAREFAFRLDDNIERQHVVEADPMFLPQEHLWPVLIATAATESLIALAEECERRGLLREGSQFYVRAAREGISNARLALADLYRRAGRIDDALDQYREMVDAGSRDARIAAAELLVKEGRGGEVPSWLEPIDPSDHEARTLAAMALMDVCKPATALVEFQRLAEEGSAEAAGVAADIMVGDRPYGGFGSVLDRSSGRALRAVDWLASLLDKRVDTRGKIVELLIEDQAHGVNGTVEWLQQRAKEGDYASYLPGARLLAEHGRVEEALAWCDTAIARGVPGAHVTAAGLYAQAGMLDTAVNHARTGASDEPSAFTAVAEQFARRGLLHRALECFQHAAEKGDTQAWAWAAEAAAGVGSVDLAVSLVRTAVRADRGISKDLYRRVAVAMCQSGNGKYAVDWYLKNVELTSPDILIPLSDYLLDEKVFLAAVETYGKMLQVGHGQALFWVAEGLLRAGLREAVCQPPMLNSGSSMKPADNAKVAVVAELWFPEAARAGYPGAWLRAIDTLIDLRRHESAFLRTRELMRAGLGELETRFAIIHAWRQRFDTAIEMVNDQVARSVMDAVGPVASTLVRYGREEDAVRLLRLGAERGDIASHVVLADYLAMKQQYTQASDHYLIAMVHGCDVREKIADALTRKGEGGKNALEDFKRYGLTPAGRLSDPWIA